MHSVCVDASRLLTLLLPDVHSERIDALWSGWQRDHTTLLTPPLLYAEVPSVIRGAVYLRPITSEQGDLAFETFYDTSIAVRVTPRLHIISRELVRKHKRPRVCDDFCLAVAQPVDCDLSTGDRHLSNAASLPWVRWIGD